MAKPIMIQGTASNAGKSVIAAGLCRVFRQDGFSVAPFKSQNMALNSFITREGLEMGRAQVAQAEAAGIEPSVLMNPILLKPTGDDASQVIVNGEVAADMRATEYFRRKNEFLPAVRAAYRALAEQYDIIVLEGAGSPAEINLRDNDIVNMGMAAIADAPVLLVGDIDRGGVFASLYGTAALLEPDERARIKGLIVNKFRGDVEILRPGLAQLEELTRIPVVGVVPWAPFDIDDEDSLSARLDGRRKDKALDAAVIRLPRLSNFTDFNALDRHPAFSVRYVESARTLGRPDLVILPGSKNTMADLAWLRQCGLEAAVKKLAAAGTPVIGICGGYQMLGLRLEDPDGIEDGRTMRGMELLPVRTVFRREKTRTRVTGMAAALTGLFAPLAGAAFDGYEIHMGSTESEAGRGAKAFAVIRDDGREGDGRTDGMVLDNVLGSYIHGLFDSGELANRLARMLSQSVGEVASDQARYRESQYDLLADTLRKSLDMNRIYAILNHR